MEKKVKQKRIFLGPLNAKEEKLHGDYMGLEINEYKNMQKKHLKAYLQGDEFFIYKRKWYKVDYKFEE